MGIFQEDVEIFNRAPIELTVTFDGQSKQVPVGWSRLPSLVIEYAMNQNPIMGTHDPYNPHISGGKYLLGVKGKKAYPCTPLTKEEWAEHLSRPCDVDEQRIFEDRYGMDPKAKLVSYGKGRATTASSRHEAGSTPQGISSFSGKQ